MALIFSPNLPASEKLPEQQIFWGTDPLGAPEIYQLYTAYMFLLALVSKIDEKAFNYEPYPRILVSFLGKTEHFSVKNGAFYIVGKQKHRERREGYSFLPLRQLKYSSLLDVRFTIYLTHKS